MKNVKKMIQAGLKKFTVITILGVFLMTSLIPVSAATKVSKIKWSAYRKTMYVGNAQRFAVKITPAKASKAKLGWKTSNKKIAKVSAKGVVTPVKAGKATITCYVKSQKSKKVTCKVTVKKQKVTAITFAKASVAVQKGKTVSNPAIVTPTYAANKKVTYKSSSTSVATVSTSGVVTGKKVGTATITATAADGSKKKNSYKVTVVTPITKNSAKFIAHRGLSAEAPENTIKAYELAGGAGFWGAETDVRMTKDKKFILQHDLTSAIMILCLAWTLSGVCGAEYLNIQGFVKAAVGGSTMAIAVMPVIFFLISLGLAFATGTSWGTFGILIPISVTILSANYMMMSVCVGAILAGAVCGDHISPISDTTILSSAGAQCRHIDHVATQMPYALTVALCASVGYILSGITGNGYIGLAGAAISLALAMMIIVITAKRGR